MQLQNQQGTKHAPSEAMYVTQALTTRMSSFVMKTFQVLELKLRIVMAMT